MTLTAIKNYGLILYDLTIGAFHLGLIAYLVSIFYWPIYTYFQTGFLWPDVQTYVAGFVIVLITSIECFKKAIAVFNKLALASKDLAR